MGDRPTYKIHRIFKKKLRGATSPHLCSLYGIIKHDNRDAPYCVYNEHVAMQLARHFRTPVCDGVLTITAKQLAFVSLKLTIAGISLPNARESQNKRICELYPAEAAALMVFDILIGNFDRNLNMKATVATPQHRLLRGFDHSESLLGICTTPWDSIIELASKDLIVHDHPFYGKLPWHRIKEAIFDIDCHKDDYMPFHAACVHEKPFNNVPVKIQKALAASLVVRAENLKEIISKHEGKVANGE